MRYDEMGKVTEIVGRRGRRLFCFLLLSKERQAQFPNISGMILALIAPYVF